MITMRTTVPMPIYMYFPSPAETFAVSVPDSDCPAQPGLTSLAHSHEKSRSAEAGAAPGRRVRLAHPARTSCDYLPTADVGHGHFPNGRTCLPRTAVRSAARTARRDTARDAGVA